MSRHPVLEGVGVTTAVWVVAIAAGVGASSVAVDAASGLATLGVSLLVSAAFGVPGALVAGARSATAGVVGLVVRGYAAAAGGGLLATVLAVTVFQAVAGVGPALAAGDAGAAAYSAAAFGFLGVVVGVEVLVASLLAAPAALLGPVVASRIA